MQLTFSTRTGLALPGVLKARGCRNRSEGKWEQKEDDTGREGSWWHVCHEMPASATWLGGGGRRGRAGVEPRDKDVSVPLSSWWGRRGDGEVKGDTTIRALRLRKVAPSWEETRNSEKASLEGEAMHFPPQVRSQLGLLWMDLQWMNGALGCSWGCLGSWRRHGEEP